MSRPYFPLPKLAAGLRDSWQQGYTPADLRHDILAGLTTGTVAIPLSMALAIATGVAPQHGLYTAIVAGIVIALAGGSRFSVSGPTAAFVVILMPIVEQHGLGGLLLATLMAGVILTLFGIARMGRLLQFVPYPVVLGFTAGIAIVIAVFQLPDFLGLPAAPETGGHFTDKLVFVATSLPTINAAELAVAALTLATLLLWPKLRTPLPAPLAGLAIGAAVAYGINHWGADNTHPIATIASRFSWVAGDLSGHGIPALAPTLTLPWRLPGADGTALVLDFALFRALLGPAFAIAALGAIESLLCAVVADGLTRTRHDPDAELIGQGLGNLVAPLFGGITATAAIARTATNIRSGARSPLASVVHGLVVLAAILVFAHWLGLVPMASLAALLLVVAWNMAEPRHVLNSLRSAPAGDIAVLITCLVLTVLFDMVLAVAVGIGLASALFMRRMAQLTVSDRVDPARDALTRDLPAGVTLYDINGPLFFGAAEKAISSLRVVDPQVKVVIVDMTDVPTVDGTAIAALHNLIGDLQHHGVRLILCGLPARIVVKLRRAGIRTSAGQLAYSRNLAQAVTITQRWLSAANAGS